MSRFVPMHEGGGGGEQLKIIVFVLGFLFILFNRTFGSSYFVDFYLQRHHNKKIKICKMWYNIDTYCLVILEFVGFVLLLLLFCFKLVTLN